MNSRILIFISISVAHTSKYMWKSAQWDFKQQDKKTEESKFDEATASLNNIKKKKKNYAWFLTTFLYFIYLLGVRIYFINYLFSFYPSNKRNKTELFCVRVLAFVFIESILLTGIYSYIFLLFFLRSPYDYCYIFVIFYYFRIWLLVKFNDESYCWKVIVKLCCCLLACVMFFLLLSFIRNCRNFKDFIKKSFVFFFNLFCTYRKPL